MALQKAQISKRRHLQPRKLAGCVKPYRAMFLAVAIACADVPRQGDCQITLCARLPIGEMGIDVLPSGPIFPEMTAQATISKTQSLEDSRQKHRGRGKLGAPSCPAV